MNKHKLTPVQKRVLKWISESKYVTRIETGHKSTTMTINDYGETIIRCQTLVPYFLLHHGYIQLTDGLQVYELTAKGESYAAKSNPRSTRRDC